MALCGVCGVSYAEARGTQIVRIDPMELVP